MPSEEKNDFGLRLESIGDGFLVTCDLNGAETTDVKVRIDGKRLSVIGEERLRDQYTANPTRYVEEDYGDFQAALELPRDIDGGSLRAELHDRTFVLTFKGADAPQAREASLIELLKRAPDTSEPSTASVA